MNLPEYVRKEEGVRGGYRIRGEGVASGCWKDIIRRGDREELGVAVGLTF